MIKPETVGIALMLSMFIMLMILAFTLSLGFILDQIITVWSRILF